MRIGYAKMHAIWTKTDGHCAYCGCKITDHNLTVDHRIPRVEGGTNDLDNLYLCCKHCNSKKGTKFLNEFRYRVCCEEQDIPVYTDWQRLHLACLGILEKVLPEPKKFYFEKEIPEHPFEDDWIGGEEQND